MKKFLTLFLLGVMLSLAQVTPVTITTPTNTLNGTSTVGVPTTYTIPAGNVNVLATLTSSLAPVVLPVEVFGPEGTTMTTSLYLPNPPPGPYQLYLKVHGVKYETEASVQINNSIWLPLNTATVTLLGNAKVFGGIGGGFSTLQMLVPLPDGVVIPGVNTIRFKFNATNGVTSGYRVLGVNLQAGGTNLVAASSFIWEDPSTWQPPSTLPSDISAGRTLWQTASLTDPAPGASFPIKAHCADCHTADGKDLKYFNYSNTSIITRAEFHGLSLQQGQQIASYIRSLNFPSLGRPWNPPYQPGPGMDSLPVANWAAGAGLDAVLDTDQQMLPYITPITATGYLNARETPVMFQFPDWNSWLPIVHPVDGFPSFGASPLATAFGVVAKQIAAAPTIAAGYKGASLSSYSTLFANEIAFGKANPLPTTWTPLLRQTYYSVGLWELIRQWDLNQTFGLEAIPGAIFPHPALRGWYAGAPFAAAPNIQHVPAGPGLFNGTDISGLYENLAWYLLQEVVNDGQGTQSGHVPQDYGYVEGFLGKMFGVFSPLPGAALEMEILTKSLQTFTLNGAPPTTPYGWHPVATSPMTMVGFNQTPGWRGYTIDQIASLLTPYTQAWFTQASKYTPAQYYQGGYATATEDPSKTNYSQTWSGTMWYMLPRLRFYGVPASLTQQISAWAATIWPLGNWAANDAMVCTAPTLIANTACK